MMMMMMKEEIEEEMMTMITKMKTKIHGEWMHGNLITSISCTLSSVRFANGSQKSSASVASPWSCRGDRNLSNVSKSELTCPSLQESHRPVEHSPHDILRSHTCQRRQPRCPY
eukprot:766173-Hanusia_phi.AAC.1